MNRGGDRNVKHTNTDITMQTDEAISQSNANKVIPAKATAVDDRGRPGALPLREALVSEEPVTLALTEPTVGVGTVAPVAPSTPSAAELSCAKPTDGGSARKLV